MNRFRKRSFLNRLSLARIVSIIVFASFVVFVSWRTLTPPVEIIQHLSSPDGHHQARLMYVYYQSDPGIKVVTRSGQLWRTGFRLASHPDGSLTNQEAVLYWSPDSTSLFLNVNGVTIWTRYFYHSSRLKSP